MPVPRQMTAHTLEAPKGWPSPHAVDYAAKFDATELGTITGGIAFAGRCVHVASDGEYEFGVTARQMPIWLFQNSDDPDVQNEGGSTANDPHVWVGTSPTGYIMGLVAAGAYELATTEFNSALTYGCNDLLYAATGTTLSTAGVLTNAGIGGAAWPAIAAVGVVSRGRTPTAVNAAQQYPSGSQNSHRVKELFFWPQYLPGMNGRTEPTWA
jgi:hypothetical protein